ncbi:hypothetical protein TorRG33x02_341500 [Trema orientale]|uniref:Uncharacterized protein n=1 Tax=Trema orientale TaxID=63057 RepID=A0A2P5ATU3_TREOI|nr:hypothetical protein TorRG33x02_341500 [Trema orientale]
METKNEDWSSLLKRLYGVKPRNSNLSKHGGLSTISAPKTSRTAWLRSSFRSPLVSATPQNLKLWFL